MARTGRRLEVAAIKGVRSPVHAEPHQSASDSTARPNGYGADTTSEILFVVPEHVCLDQPEAATAPEWGGAAGDPIRASAECGLMGLQLKTDAAVREARSCIGGR